MSAPDLANFGRDNLEHLIGAANAGSQAAKEVLDNWALAISAPEKSSPESTPAKFLPEPLIKELTRYLAAGMLRLLNEHESFKYAAMLGLAQSMTMLCEIQSKSSDAVSELWSKPNPSS